MTTIKIWYGRCKMRHNRRALSSHSPKVCNSVCIVRHLNATAELQRINGINGISVLSIIARGP